MCPALYREVEISFRGVVQYSVTSTRRPPWNEDGKSGEGHLRETLIDNMHTDNKLISQRLRTFVLPLVRILC